MTFGLDQMDSTVQGIFFLVAVILFIIASFTAVRPIEGRPYPVLLVPLGLAFFAFVFMWNAFAAS